MDFWKLWYWIKEYADEILKCILSNNSYLIDALPKSERKSTIKVARTSKKLKYMNDLMIAEEASMTALRELG